MRRIYLAGVLFLLAAGPAAAQPGPEVFRLMRPVMQVLGTSPGVLAGIPAVQTELKLDDDQVKAIKEKVPQMGFGGFRKKADITPEQQERLAKMFEKLQALADVPEDKLEGKIREAFKEEIEGPTKEVEKILKPEQFTRLKQIARQQGGAAAYLTPENAKDLKLTDEQKKKLKDISDELQKDIGALVQGGGGFSAETREKMQMLNKEASDKATGVLTDEQKSKWKEITGEPFTVDLRGGRRPKKDD
jgi:hypothetical protein